MHAVRGRLMFGSQSEIILELQIGLGIARQRGKVHNEVILYSEDGIGSQVWVTLGIELSDNLLVTVSGDHHVNMSGPHGMPIKKLQQLPRRAYSG
jgi:hypothetical protein